jgi:hypothetical protein
MILWGLAILTPIFLCPWTDCGAAEPASLSDESRYLYGDLDCTSSLDNPFLSEEGFSFEV